MSSRPRLHGPPRPRLHARPHPRPGRRPPAAGFSYLEVAVGLLLVGLLFVTAHAVILGTRFHFHLVGEKLRVVHAIDKEMETVRATRFRDLGERTDAPWLSDPSELRPLPKVVARLTIEDLSPCLKRIRLQVAWGRERRWGRTAEALFYGGSCR